MASWLFAKITGAQEGKDYHIVHQVLFHASDQNRHPGGWILVVFREDPTNRDIARGNAANLVMKLRQNSPECIGKYTIGDVITHTRVDPCKVKGTFLTQRLYAYVK